MGVFLVREAAKLQRAMLTACLVLWDNQALCRLHSIQLCCIYAWSFGRNRSCRAE